MQYWQHTIRVTRGCSQSLGSVMRGSIGDRVTGWDGRLSRNSVQTTTITHYIYEGGGVPYCIADLFIMEACSIRIPRWLRYVGIHW